MSELRDALDAHPNLTPRAKRRAVAAATAFERYIRAHGLGLTPRAAQAWYNDLLLRMQPQSANVQLASLRVASKMLAIHRDDARANFARDIVTKRGRRGEKQRAFTRAQADVLIAECVGPGPVDLRDHAICVLGFATGMRRFSLVGIEVKDFRVMGGYTTVEITLKGGARHRVPLTQRTLGALQPWLGWLAKQGITSGLVFRRLRAIDLAGNHAVGKSLSESGVYTVIRERAVAAGLKGFSMHAFRHSLVTWLKAANTPNPIIAAITGHTLGKADESRMLDKVYLDLNALAGIALDALNQLEKKGEGR